MESFLFCKAAQVEQICHYIQDMFHYYVRTSGGRSFFSIEKVQHTGRGHSGGLHLSGQKFDAVGVTGNLIKNLQENHIIARL